MARSDKFTLTQKKQKLYSDFLTSFAFNKHTGYLGVVENEDSVSQALSNFFKTNHGERYMHSAFGGNLIGMLFENYDPGIAEAHRFDLIQAINQYEPRVTVTGLEIKPSDQHNTGQVFDSNELIISLVYAVKNLYGEETLDIVIKRSSCHFQPGPTSKKSL